MAKQGQLGQPSKGKLSASLEDFREKVREPQCIGVRALEWINATEPMYSSYSIMYNIVLFFVAKNHLKK